MLHQAALSNRLDREFHRKDLARWQKYYATLSKKRIPGSDEADHFSAVSSLCGRLLKQYGEEPPRKKRKRKKLPLTLLKYPNFPEDISHRLHFLEGPGLRRQRTILLAKHAAFLSRQESASGHVLVSVGTHAHDVKLFERLVEAIDGLLAGNLTKYGFNIEYTMNPPDTPEAQSWTANPLDPCLPIAQIWADNGKANGYSFRARLFGDEYQGRDGTGLPKDLPDTSVHKPWDPDPLWLSVIEFTERNEIRAALDLVEQVPGQDREVLLDEVIYLRFLNNSPLRADDVRLLARKYIADSVIADRLSAEFNDFITSLQIAFDADPPMLDLLPRLRDDFGREMLPEQPPASDWQALREHMLGFTNPSGHRGRIFWRNIEVSIGAIERMLAVYMIDAENEFRRGRSIPEIGRGWASEVALLDLVRTLWPNSVHQWRPAFLGRQSVDIYVPEINLAIEYQGKQHYEAVSLFGGDEGLKATRARDERKRSLLAAQNVRLLEWPYDASITSSELQRRLLGLGVPMPQ